MNLLSDTYIFYADVYFIQNFIIKLAVIYLSLCSNKLRFVVSTIKGIGRIVLAAGIGTLLEISGLLFLGSYNLLLVLTHLFEIPLMMWFVIRKECRQMIKPIIVGYFWVMVINGVLEVLWNWFGEQGNYVFYLCIACGLVSVGLHIWKNYARMQKGIFPVEILHNENQIFLYGLYDSGNRLKDPYTKKGVHIVSPDILSKLELDVSKEVFISYQTLGNEEGLIPVYYLEHIRIRTEQKTVECEMVPVGVAEESLFHNKRYQMILNEEVW